MSSLQYGLPDRDVQAFGSRYGVPPIRNTTSLCWTSGWNCPPHLVFRNMFPHPPDLARGCTMALSRRSITGPMIRASSVAWRHQHGTLPTEMLRTSIGQSLRRRNPGLSLPLLRTSRLGYFYLFPYLASCSPRVRSAPLRLVLSCGSV